MPTFSIDMDAVRDILMEADALRFDRQGDNLVPILGDNEVIRYWPEIQPDIAHQCVAYLESYCSAKNNSKLRYVDNPIVNGEVKPGRWRQARVYVEMIGDVARVVQVLRRGWRTTLMTTGDTPALDFSECRVIRSRELEGNSEAVAGVSNTTSDNEEKYLMVRFVNISNAHVKAVMSELRAVTTVANLTINGENYGSDYRKLFATCNIDDTDGSMAVDVLFAESQFTLNSYNQWGTLTGLFGGEVSYLWGVPKELAQTIITAYRNLGAGRGATCSYSVEQGTVDMVLNAKRRDAEGNLVKVPFETGIKTLQMCSRHVYTFYYFDVEDPDAADYEVGTATETDPFPATAGVVYRKTVRSNNDDTYDVEIDVDTEVEREAALEDVIVSSNYFTKVTRTIDLGAGTPAASLDHESGKDKSRQVSVKDNCLHDIVNDVKERQAARQWYWKYPSENGFVEVWIGKNCTEEEYIAVFGSYDTETGLIFTPGTSSLTAAESNLVKKGYNELGLIDYEIVKDSTPGLSSGDSWGGGSVVIEWEAEDADGNIWCIRRKWCTSKNTAEAFLEEVPSGAHAAPTGLTWALRTSGGGHTTTAQPSSRGRFVATTCFVAI